MLSAFATRVLGAFLAAMVAAALAGCAPSRGGPIPYDVPQFTAPDAPNVAVSSDNYVITTGDKLGITVFGAADLSKDYVVDQAGAIAVPLIGSVPVAGRSPNMARQEIARRLGERYLQKPDVTVEVKESINRNVTVDGSVRAPGAYPVTGEMTLIRTVALARGTDERANPRRVAVFRTVGGQRMAAAFDLTAIRRGEMPDPAIYAGDIVVVDGNDSNSRFVTLLQTLPLIALFRPY